jgi:hypothetical protein
MSDKFSAAPRPSHRLIPSRFPPIGLFDTVSTKADLPAVLDLVGWTNDRLVADRLARLPDSEWVYGVSNSSIIMAAFLHVAPGGMRFNGPDLGAWYASDDIRTAAAEVGHHLRRESIAREKDTVSRTYRAYSATLLGDYLDIRRQQAALPDIYASERYDASQVFGEAVRASGGAGLLYSSVRRADGENVVCHRPRNIADVMQTDHFQVLVSGLSRTINVTKLSS